MSQAQPTFTEANRPYRPYGAALELLRCRVPEVILSGPAGTGKSRGCLEKVHLCAEKWPGMRALIVRKTRESLTESALVTFEEKVIPEGHAILQGAQRGQRGSYVYPNGSVVVVGGLRQAGRDMTQRVMSTEFDLIYVQEAIELSEDDWEKLTTRLRNGVMPFQQLLADTNPDAPTHWIKRRADRGQLLMLESRHEDNPLLWDTKLHQWTGQGQAYIAALDALTGARKPRLRHGRWVQAEGAVYEEWDRNLHLIPLSRLPGGSIPASWRRIRSVDFGHTNPFVCQWWAVDPDGRMYLYREIYRTKSLVADLAKEILKLSAGERIVATVADHDAEDRATLERAGITTQPAWKAISPGIEAVQKRLRKAGDGQARLFIVEGALTQRDEALEAAKKPVSTEQEFDSYIWPKSQEGRSLKEAPVDEDNHGMDAMRYAVAFVDKLHLQRGKAGGAAGGARPQLQAPRGAVGVGRR